LTNVDDKTRIHRLLGIPVPCVYVIAYLVGAMVQLAVPLTISSDLLLTTTQVISILLLAIGVILAVWAQWIFRKEHTTTDPSQTCSKFITWGPYKFSRNPMYVGLFLLFIGLSGIFTLVWSIIAQLFVFYYVNWIVIPVEETQLQKTFRQAYEEYCKKVRRWI
jgi:protein-S-isoprenylcysteine O-methyltransferase Ste14